MFSVVVSKVSKMFSWGWKFVAMFLFERQRMKKRDATTADKIREATSKTEDRHEKAVADLSDAELDERLRELRKRQRP